MNEINLFYQNQGLLEKSDSNYEDGYNNNNEANNESLLDDERICRICFEEEDDSENNKLINPCQCKGSLKWIHLNCLNEWRATSINPEAFSKCLICKFTYQTESVILVKTHFKKFNLFLARHSFIFFFLNLLFITFLSLFLMKIDSNHHILKIFFYQNNDNSDSNKLPNDGNLLELFEFFLNNNYFTNYFTFSMVIYGIILGLIFVFNFMLIKNKKLYLNHYRIRSWCYILIYACLLFISLIFPFFISALILTFGIQIIINRHYQVIENLERANETTVLNYSEELRPYPEEL